MLIFMFPGQGSQKKGMGRELFGEFRDLVAAADEELGYSIEELCLEDPRNELNRTQFTQPALYVVNALTYQKRLREGAVPDVLLGHSLGEFDALLAAGVFDFVTGLRLVKARGQAMSEAGGGAMAAVMNIGADEIRDLLAEHGLDEIDLANFNTPNQIVISGRREDVLRAQPLFEERNKAFAMLNTSGAFHSRWMLPAKERFDAVLAGVALLPPKITVVANYTARPYDRGNLFSNLSNQICSPVRWAESIEYLIGLGATTFEEVGDSRVLTNLVAKIKAKAAPARREAAAASSAGQPPAPRASTGDTVRRWNEQHRVGTKVRSKVVKDALLETRTEAVVLFGHRAAVYVKGYEGYFDLDEITVVPD